MTDESDGNFSHRLAQQRDEVFQAWRAAAVAALFPQEGARFFLDQSNRFANPVGYGLADCLNRLTDYLIAGGDINEATLAALIFMVRVLVVQDHPPSRSLGFLVAVKDIVRRTVLDLPGDWDKFDRRVDEVVMRAFDLFVNERERLHRIRGGMAQRQFAKLIERIESVGGLDIIRVDHNGEEPR